MSPRHEPEKIISMVDLAEKDRSEIHNRMDADMDRYFLKDYVGELDENGEPIMDDFKKVTSSDPQNYANLSIHLIGTAKRTFIAPQQQQTQQSQRKIRNMKELYTLGVFSSSDERRSHLGMPPLQSSLAFQTTIRGRWAQRALLIKEAIEMTNEQEEERRQFEELGLAEFLPETPNTRTYVDVTDWDPRNTYWGMGRHGKVWACHKQMKSDAELREEYPDLELPAQRADISSDEKSHTVYDYFDEEINLVIVDNAETMAKNATPHGMGKLVPVSTGNVGALPLIQADGEDYEVFYGESIFRSNRHVFDLTNFNLSYMAETCKRALNQSFIYESQDGNKTTDNNPNLDGSMVPIKSGGAEKLYPIPQQEMIQTGLALMGLTHNMQQRGGYSDVTFGQLGGGTPSGFAITQLRQGAELTTGPAVDATRLALQDIANILADGYATSNFDTMTLAGHQQDAHRTYFSEEITAEVVAQGGKIEVKLEPELPQDEASKVALAQLAREGDVPLLDDRFLRENVLMIQDTDQMEAAISAQLAKRGSPVALAYESMISAEEEGEEELAQLWLIQLKILLLQQQAELAQAQIIGAQAAQVTQGGDSPGGGPTGGGSPRGTANVGSNILPAPVQGIAPPTPTPQAGPLVAPGTPRPTPRRESPADFAIAG